MTEVVGLVPTPGLNAIDLNKLVNFNGDINTPQGFAGSLNGHTTQGVKFDGDKLPYDLIPPELLESVAKVLQFGAKKYAPRNWEQGMNWSRVFSALMRHMWAWWRGEKKDPETGFSHLEHAACCIAFLVAYEQRKVGQDDRPELS